MKMKKVKKTICLLLSVCLLICGSLSVYASESQNNEWTTDNTEWTSVSTVTNPSDLQKIAETENLNIPEGYHLESVETFIYTDNDSLTDSSASQNTTEIVSNQGIIYNIKNVKDNGDGFYYSSEYDSDWFYGPATVSEEYSRTNSVKMSVNVNVTNSVITGAVGYDVTKTFTNKKTFSTTVASGKKVNVKVHTNYKKTTFDIYNKVTGNCAQSGAYTMKPVGLIFKQYTYAQ